jgi:hypothetical protein
VLSGMYDIRSSMWQHRRLDWNDHVAQLMHDGVFENVQDVMVEGGATGAWLRIMMQRQNTNRWREAIKCKLGVRAGVEDGVQIRDGHNICDKKIVTWEA